MANVPIDKAKVDSCREAAGLIADDVQRFIDRQTTVGVERTVARAYGVAGADPQGTPLANALVDRIHQAGFTGYGVAYFLGRGLVEGASSVQEAAEQIAYGGAPIVVDDSVSAAAAKAALEQETSRAIERIDNARRERETRKAKFPAAETPLKYVIVATGNIYDDAVQAKAARFAGADIVAVIRATAQSLLDYVPEGPTTEGYGGTYATQENFRILRRARGEARESTWKSFAPKH